MIPFSRESRLFQITPLVLRTAFRLLTPPVFSAARCHPSVARRSVRLQSSGETSAWLICVPAHVHGGDLEGVPSRDNSRVSDQGAPWADECCECSGRRQLSVPLMCEALNLNLGGSGFLWCISWSCRVVSILTHLVWVSRNDLCC